MTKQEPTTYYFAYGANTNLDNMAHRCPNAQPVGRATLDGYRLVFRHVADIVRDDFERIHGALWKITPECERALDRYEGFPNLYVKDHVTVTVGNRRFRAMVYVMRQEKQLLPPSKGYEELLREGYQDFSIPQSQLDSAIPRLSMSHA